MEIEEEKENYYYYHYNNNNNNNRNKRKKNLERGKRKKKRKRRRRRRQVVCSRSGNERMHAWAMHTLFSQEYTDAQFLLKLDGIFAEVFQDISFRGSADPAAMAELKSRAETLTELPESKLSQIFENAQQLAQTATEEDMENARAEILDIAQRTIVGSALRAF